MTLEQFAATGRDCANLKTVLDFCESVPGRVYIGTLYIEKTQTGWTLLLDRSDYEGTLSELETMLYSWACSEDCF